MGMVPWPLIKLPMIPEQDFSGRVVSGNIDVKGGDGESVSVIADYAGEMRSEGDGTDMSWNWVMWLE